MVVTCSIQILCVSVIISQVAYTKLNPEDAKVDPETVKAFLAKVDSERAAEAKKKEPLSKKPLSERERKRLEHEAMTAAKRKMSKVEKPVKTPAVVPPMVSDRTPSSVKEYGDLVRGAFTVLQILDKQSALMEDICIGGTDITQPVPGGKLRHRTIYNRFSFILEGIDTTRAAFKEGGDVGGTIALVNKATYATSDGATKTVQVFRMVGP